MARSRVTAGTPGKIAEVVAQLDAIECSVVLVT